MPIYKNTARRIALQVRVTGGVTAYALSTWANDATAKMYYSKDGAAGTAITPTRIEATLGGWEIAVGTLTSTVWNCDELRIWWEGSGIDFGEVVFYPEQDWSNTKSGYVDGAITSRAAAGDAMALTSGERTTLAASIWNALTSGMTTAGSIAKRLIDYLTGDIYARIGAPVGASISADIASVQGDTDNIQTRIPTSLVSGRMDSSVGAMATDVITAASIQVDAIGSAEIAASAVTEIQAGLSTLDASGVRAGVGLSAANLDTQLAAIASYIDTEIATILSRIGVPSVSLVSALAALQNDTDDIQTRLPAALLGGRMDSNVGAVAANTLTAAALAADAVAEIADGVWDETLSGHLTAGSTGNALNASGSAGDPWATALPGAYGAGSAGKIIGDNINAAISSRASQTSLDTVDDYIDTEVAAIKAKTDNLPSDPADASDIAALLSTIAGYIDTEVASILADTTNIKTRIPAALVSGRMDSSVGAMAADVITAAAIAANAIGASELASDAVAEIQSGLATATELAATKAIAQAAASAAGQLG